MGIDLDSYRIHIGCFNGVFVHIHARRNPTFPAANCRTLLLKGFLGKAVSFLVIAVLLMRGGVELNPGPCARALQTRRRGEVEEIKLNKDHTFLSHAKSFGFFVDYINANAAYLQTSTFSSTADLHEEHSTKSSQSKVFSKTKLLCKPTCQFHTKDTNCTVNRYFKSQKNIYVDELFSKKDFGLYYYSKTYQIKKCVFHARPGKLCNVSITEEDESLADYHSDNVHPVNKNNTTVTGHPTNAFDTFINDVTMYDLLLFLPFYHNEKEIPVDTNDVKRKGLDMPSCKPKIVKSTTLETALGVDGPRGDLFPIGRGDGWVYMVLSCFEDAVVLTYNFIRAILYTTFALAQSTANFGFLASPADLAVSFAIHVANVATYVATQGRHFCKAYLLRSSELCRKGRMKFTLTLRTRLHEFFFMARRHTDLCLEAIHTAERTSDNHLTLNDIHLCRKQTISDSKCLQRDVLGAFKITDGNTLRAVLGCQESLCNDQIRKDVDLNERVTGQLKVLTTPGQFCFHRVTIVYSMAYPWWLLYRQTLCLCRSTRASARANVSRGKDRALSTVYTLTDKCYRKYTMCILEKYLWQQSFCATIIQNSNGNTKIKFPDLDLDGNVDGNVNANLNTSPKGKFISLRNDVNSSTMLDFDSHVFLLKSSFLFLLFLSCILGSLRFSGLWGILRCCFSLLLQSVSAVVLLPYSVVMCLSIMLGIRMTLSQITWSKNMFVALSKPLVQFQEITHFNFVTIFFNCSFLSPTLHYDYKEKPSPEEKSSSMEKSNPKKYSPKEKPSHKKKSCPDANSNPKKHSAIEKSSPKEKPSPIKKSCPKEKPSPKKTSCPKKKPSPKEKPTTMEKSSPMKKSSPVEKSSPFDCRRPTCQSLYLSTQTYPLSFVCICFDGLTCAILKHSRTGVTQVEGEYLGYNKYVHSGQSELITWKSDVDKDYHLPIQGLDSRHVFDNITTMLNVQYSLNRTGNEILLLTCVKFDFSACTRVKVRSPAFFTLEVPDVLSSRKAGSEKVYLFSVNRMEIVGFIWIVNVFSRLQIEMFIKLAYSSICFSRVKIIIYSGQVQIMTHIKLMYFRISDIQMQGDSYVWLKQVTISNSLFQTETFINLMRSAISFSHVKFEIYLTTLYKRVQIITYIGLVQFKTFDTHVQSRTRVGLVQFLTQLTQAQVVAPFGKIHFLISVILMQTKLLIKQVQFVVCNFPKRHYRFLASRRERHRWRCFPPRRPEVLENPVCRYNHSTRFRFKAKYLLKLCHHRFILLRVLRFWRFRFPLKVNASHFKSRQIRSIDEEQRVTIESDPTSDTYKSRPSHYLLRHIKFGQTWSSAFQWNIKNVRGESASFGLNDADNPDQSHCGSGHIPPTNSQNAPGVSGNTSDSSTTNGFGGDRSGRRDDGDESEDESQDEEGEQSQSGRTRRQKKKDKRFLDLLKSLLLWSKTRQPRALTYYPHSEVHMTTPEWFHQLFSGAVTDSGYDVRIVDDDKHDDDEALEENVQNEHHEIQCGGDLEVQQLLQQLVHWMPTTLPLALTWPSTSRDPPSSRRQPVCGSNPNSVVQQHETLQSSQQLQVLPRNPFLLRDFITLLSIPEEGVHHDFLSEDEAVPLRLTQPIQETQYLYNAGDTDITRNCENRGVLDADSRRCSVGLTPAASLQNDVSVTQDDNWQSRMNGLRRCSRCNKLDSHERLSPCNHLLCPDCSRNFRTRNQAANVPCPVCGKVVHSTERSP